MLFTGPTVVAVQVKEAQRLCPLSPQHLKQQIMLCFDQPFACMVSEMGAEWQVEIAAVANPSVDVQTDQR